MKLSEIRDKIDEAISSNGDLDAAVRGSADDGYDVQWTTRDVNIELRRGVAFINGVL